jgi:hypothetical protein
MGLLVLSAPVLAGSGLVLLLGLFFLADGLRQLGALWMGWRRRQPVRRAALAAAGNLAVAAVLFVLWNNAATAWVVALAGAARILGAGWNMVTAPIHTIGDAYETFSEALGLPDGPEVRATGERSTRSVSAGPSTAAGSSRSSPRCSPSTSAAWRRSGRWSASSAPSSRS